MNSNESFNQLRISLSASVIGQEHVVEHLLIGLLANGNILMEGLPGTAKTRSIKILAKLINSDFSRVQFTPDLLPSDVTGSEIYREHSGEFEFQAGPLFGNLILADEINRAPAKVQAALLEAMEERQVTVGGTTHKLPELFMVLATQNPIEQEGTYPLPEAQMDRFLLYIRVDYSNAENELKILRLVRGENTGETSKETTALDPAVVFEARKEVDKIHVSEAVEKYIVDLVISTREPENYDAELASWIKTGASPRATIALDVASRAHAWLNGADFVSPENVQAVAPACLAHRLHLSYEAEAAGLSRSDIVSEILKRVAVI